MASKIAELPKCRTAELKNMPPRADNRSYGEHWITAILESLEAAKRFDFFRTSAGATSVLPAKDFVYNR